MHLYRLKIWLIMTAVLVGACHSRSPLNLQPSEPRTVSTAMPPPTDTHLAQAIESALSDHPADQSAFYLLHDGLSAFVARLALIDAAEVSLDVQYYIFHDDTSGRILLGKLIEAADRGVRVRLLVDDIGTQVESPWAAALDTHQNISIRIFNPVSGRKGLRRTLQQAVHFGRINHRMHNKLLVADGLALITGGRNIGDEYFSNTHVDFQDTDIFSIGAVLPDAADSFNRYWDSPVAIPLDQLLSADKEHYSLETLRDNAPAFFAEQSETSFAKALLSTNLSQAIQSGTVPLIYGTASLFYDPPEKAYQRETLEPDQYLGFQLRQILAQSHSRLHISSAYFVPGKDGTAFIRGLTDEGVEVHILTNSLSTTDVAIVHSGYARYRKPLLKSGVKLSELRSESGQEKRIHWFKGKSSASLHAKTFVIDHDRAIIGSINLDGRSIIQNTEIALLIHSEEINQQLETLFQKWVSPESAWNVAINDKKLAWHAENNGEPITQYKDPKTSTWLRFKVWMMSWLPVEAQI
jgi:cardiolipin synthase C